MATIHLSFPPRVPGLEKDLEMELCRWYPPFGSGLPITAFASYHFLPFMLFAGYTAILLA